MIPEVGLHLITRKVAQVSVTTWRCTARITKTVVSAAPVTPTGIRSLKHPWVHPKERSHSPEERSAPHALAALFRGAGMETTQVAVDG